MSKEGIVIEAGLTRGKLFRRRDVVAYNEYEANRSLGQWEPGMLRLASLGFYGQVQGNYGLKQLIGATYTPSFLR